MALLILPFYEVVDNLHACLYIQPSVPFLVVFLVFAHHYIYKKCQTKWQYEKYGKTADLNNISLALVGIKFLSRMSTPIL